MRIRYTITTKTKKCPYCGYVLDETTSGELAPFYGIFLLFTFPIVIPFFMIKYWGLKDPSIPRIGPLTIKCPKCELPIRTENYELESLDGENLLNYKYRFLFILLYIVGGIAGLLFFAWACGSGTLYGVCGFLLSFLILGAIIFYRNQIKKLKFSENDIKKHNKIEQNIMYCRKCGEILQDDSIFCQHCGTKIT